VGTHRVGGITEEEMAMLRIVAGEMGQAWARLEPALAAEEPHITTPAEFRQKIAAGRHGALVYLDVVKQDALVEKFGQPSFDKALREAAVRLKSLLPAGGFLCRRAEGDYVAFLPEQSEEAARRWAAQAVAAASLVPVTTPDGRARIPMNLRAKVAVLSPQLDRKSSQFSA
jgi:GGDEF domain-containing protein